MQGNGESGWTNYEGRKYSPGCILSRARVMEDQTRVHTQRSVSPLSHTSSGLSGPSLNHDERIHASMGSDSDSATAQDHQSMLERSKDNEALAAATKVSRYTRATSHWSRLQTD